MRKRLIGPLVLCAAIVALTLPASTSAAKNFAYTVERNVCVSGAGKYHFGRAALRVRIIEYGKSGANRFTYKAQAWVKRLNGTKWTMEYQWPLFEKTFPNDFDSYYNSRQYVYEPKHNVYVRIVVTVRALKGATTLYKRTVYGKIC
jgi:hypothetical protein